MLDYFIKNEIEIGGIDFQNSSKYSASSSFFNELKGFDSLFISETFKWDSFLMNYTTTKRIESEKNLSTIDSLKLCKTILNKNYHFIDSVFTGKTNLSKEDLYLSRIMKNKLFFLSVCDKREKWMVLRDSVMGANIQWFCDSLYPNEKIIFWGANEHIAKVKSNFGKNYYAGSVVSDKIKKQSYYIGLYAFSGEIYSYNSGRYKMRKLSNKSLEGRIHHYFKSNNDVFLDFTITSKIDSFNWLNNLTKSYVWGNIPVEIIPAKNYDGIILINKINTIY
jgi:hypothetical protein